MAQDVAQLIIRLEARVEKLEAGLRKGERKINRFSSRASKSFLKVGRAIKRMAFRLSGVGTLLAGIVSVAGFGALIRGAIDAASAMETFHVRLRNVIGSVTRTNQLIGELGDFAAKVAPSFRDVVDAAATLGTVALGAAPRVARLTETATNIAAVTGLSLPQAASNLQRTLSQGIGAADLFRERGVRAIVEAVTGIPNLIAQPIAVVAKAMDDTFGPGGVFGDVAVQFANTLPGSISRAGDALFQFQAALGEALSPSIVGFLNLLIQTLNRLQTVIEENEEDFDNFARGGVLAFTNGIITLGEVFIKVLKFFSDARTRILEMKGAVASAAAVFAKAALALSVDFTAAGREEFSRGAAAIDEDLADLAQGAHEAEVASNKFKVILDKLAASLAKTKQEVNSKDDPFGGAEIRRSQADIEEFQKKSDELREKFSTAPPLDARVLRETNAALKRQANLIEQTGISLGRAGADPFQGQLDALDKQSRLLTDNLAKTRGAVDQRRQLVEMSKQQLALLENQEKTEKTLFDIQQLKRSIAKAELDQATKQATFDAARVQTEARLRDLAVERSRVEGRREASIQTSINIQQTLPETLDQLRELDASRADEIERALHARIREAQSITDIEAGLKAARAATQAALATEQEKQAKQFAAQFVGPFRSALGGALTGIIRGEGVDFGQALGQLAEGFLGNAMSNVLDGFQEKLTEVFQDKGLGKGLGTSLQAGLGIVMALLAGLFQDTTASVTNDLVDSAVDQTRELRGVIAGPTDVPILEVAPTIRDAFIPIQRVLEASLQIQEAQLDVMGGTTGVPSGEQGGSSLPSGSDLNSAPAIG